ncbi:hypothetical protein [Psychroserpens damuponensis]|uniref:hypothetical protein n=1 Tax=Psychroserpens damuponensis TaxID=943936 RepID=UPI00058DB8F9|nr:hypothetical protein [Psychroserpens damuponensis]
MKADLAPKHIRKIDDSIILWFKESNRYVVVPQHTWTLISLYIESKNKDAYLNHLEHELQLGDLDASTAIFTEISKFLIEVNVGSNDDNATVTSAVSPKLDIERFYQFDTKCVKINFESTRIESIIHPQIEHHLSNRNVTVDTEFDIFKIKDFLYIHKNKKHIGRYPTHAFHLLQGRFALELTNTIHDKHADDWVATFHASTVANTKEAIMIIGDSGNGKSTLSALLMTNGFDLLADDFTPLHLDTNLYRYPSAISIKKGAFSILDAEISNFNNLKIHTNGPKKVNLKYVPQNLSFTNKNSHFPCTKIVYVKFDKTKSSELHHISVEKIVETLIPDSWISPNEHHAHKFMNWLNDITCYELTYSDNDFAISKFKALFNQ